MDHLMDLPMDHLMVQLMEPLMELLMDHLTDKPTHLMDPGINPCISLLLMALYHPSLKVPLITILTCSPIWVKLEEITILLAKAMVYIEINLM